MMTFQEELRKYIKEYGFRTTCARSGLAKSTLMNVLNGRRPTKKSVDILYKLLKLEVDQRYVENLAARYWKWFWPGEIVKTIRINMGLDQGQFARRLGVTERTIQRLEMKNRVPKRKICKAISDLLFDFLMWKS